MSTHPGNRGISLPLGVSPRLLLELEPRHRVFLRNLGDLLLRRPAPPLNVTSRPAPFWPDVFVEAAIPARRFLQSGLYHVLALAALYGVSTLDFGIAPVTQRAAFEKRQVLHYDVAELLPAISSPSKPARVERKGQPEYARQPIISLPRRPDNSTQTIIAPSDKLLKSQVNLPNLVVWTPTPARPAAALTRAGRLTLPTDLAVVAPPPENVRNARRDLRLPGTSDVVPPPPEVAGTARPLGDLNIAPAQVEIARPVLPVGVQRAAIGEGLMHAEVAPPPPLVHGDGAGAGARPVGQLIAMGIHPSPPSGPLEIPDGNRRGIFAATPEGKPGAPGTPDIAGGGDSDGPGGRGGNGEGGIGSGGLSHPAGLFVGGPVASGPVAAVAAPATSETTSPPRRFPTAERRLMARLPSPEELARLPLPGAATTIAPEAGRVETEVFGEKRFYSMMLNMPNLTSAGGSWIIRFAELHQSADAGELVAPVALVKVDPKYPPDLSQLRVEGTVMLYAVIRGDGSVAEVKVLRGVEARLDENARVALTRWRFRPATKNGSAVDLEAVVAIPFRSRPVPF